MIREIKRITKLFIKRHRWLLKVYESFFRRDIYNLFSASHNKRVLFSYSTYHFLNKNYTSHSNYQESLFIANVFDKLGYCVDVTNNDRLFKGDLKRYDLIFGEGLPMYQAVSCGAQCKIIYYGTGSHPFHCSVESLGRLVSFSKKNGFFAMKSTRIAPMEWGIASSLADEVICIGNKVTKDTFHRFGATNVETIDPTFIPRTDAQDLLSKRKISISRNSFVWFGSYGLLHKGLDLAVEAFRNRPHLTLHICGYTDIESDFVNALNLPNNVIVHGFVDIMSDSFESIVTTSSFVLLPSCSEGTSTAIVTAVGNSGLIPIVSENCGFDVEDFGFIIANSSESIGCILDEVQLMDECNLKELSVNAFQKVNKRYTKDNFENKFFQLLDKSLK
ncbi:hypothetical protein VCSRO150_2280 [Vibrio cholerae]|nr:putative glycosyltransferase [Vibrio cholerae]GHW27482.1 hypothetical protein VCSRO150_2280 [Vibrio cholerae]